MRVSVYELVHKTRRLSRAARLRPSTARRKLRRVLVQNTHPARLSNTPADLLGHSLSLALSCCGDLVLKALCTQVGHQRAEWGGGGGALAVAAAAAAGVVVVSILLLLLLVLLLLLSLCRRN